MSKKEVAIQARSIVKKFGKNTAVNHLYLSIPRNTIFGLLGSNGAGKTTTINMLTGLLLPDEGSINILGMDARKNIEKIRKKISLVPQTLSIYNDLTIEENLEFFAGMYIKDNDEINKRIKSILKALEITEQKDKKVDHLSGGFKRRCSIACSLISEPEILFLDEPLTGIDIYTNELIMNYLKSLKNVTIIFTTHSIKEAESVCDYVVFMDKGVKILEGQPDKLREKYSKKFGETILVDFSSKVNIDKIEKHLKKISHIKYVAFANNSLSFTSSDISNTIIDVMNYLEPFKEEIENVDIIKPGLEEVFTKIMER